MHQSVNGGEMSWGGMLVGGASDLLQYSLANSRLHVFVKWLFCSPKVQACALLPALSCMCYMALSMSVCFVPK